ncbi:MAG: type IV pilus modification PilV family protein [Luteolibacter sp.]|jgi:type II secretory pathway pseudopilin PulG
MMNSARTPLPQRGLTLMEVVIAIGVIAFVIPLFLALSKSAGDSRLDAEADTRSAWIAREVQREILAAWAEPARASALASPIHFPDFASEAEPVMLAYDVEGNFLTNGGAEDFTGRCNIPNAVYLVAIHGEAYSPPGTPTGDSPLSLIQIRILHPAKAPPENRREYRYQLISTRSGIL